MAEMIRADGEAFIHHEEKGHRGPRLRNVRRGRWTSRLWSACIDRRRVIDTRIEYWSSSGDILEIESPTITPEEVLVASGHVGEFNDLMTTCKS